MGNKNSSNSIISSNNNIINGMLGASSICNVDCDPETLGSTVTVTTSNGSIEIEQFCGLSSFDCVVNESINSNTYNILDSLANESTFITKKNLTSNILLLGIPWSGINDTVNLNQLIANTSYQVNASAAPIIQDSTLNSQYFIKETDNTMVLSQQNSLTVSSANFTNYAGTVSGVSLMSLQSVNSPNIKPTGLLIIVIFLLILIGIIVFVVMIIERKKKVSLEQKYKPRDFSDNQGSSSFFNDVESSAPIYDNNQGSSSFFNDVEPSAPIYDNNQGSSSFFNDVESSAPIYDNNQGYDNQGYDNQGYDNQGYDNQGYDNQGYESSESGYESDQQQSFSDKINSAINNYQTMQQFMGNGEQDLEETEHMEPKNEPMGMNPHVENAPMLPPPAAAVEAPLATTAVTGTAAEAGVSSIAKTGGFAALEEGVVAMAPEAIAMAPEIAEVGLVCL